MLLICFEINGLDSKNEQMDILKTGLSVNFLFTIVLYDK
jgi:hypothetical protein